MSQNRTQSAEDAAREIPELQKAIADVATAAKEHAKQRAFHEAQMLERRKAHRQACEEHRALESRLKRAEHIAAGFCAKQMRDSDLWHPTYRNCKNKAKPGSFFCGVHKNAK